MWNSYLWRWFLCLPGSFFGAVIASVTTWRILRSRIEATTRKTTEAQIEVATMREQNTRVVKSISVSDGDMFYGTFAN